MAKRQGSGGVRAAGPTALVDLAAVVDTSPLIVVVWRHEPGWPVEYISRGIARCGVEPEDVRSGRVRWRDLCYPHDAHRIENDTRTHLDAGDDEFRQQYRLRDEHGGYRWYIDRTMVERDPSGRVLRLRSVLWDVNERVLAEERSLAQAILSRRLVESSPLGAVVLRMLPIPPFMQPILINPALRRMLAVPDDATVALLLEELNHPERILRDARCLWRRLLPDAALLRRVWARARAFFFDRQFPQGEEWCFSSLAGDELVVRITAAACPLPEGDDCIAIFLEDVTAERQAAAALRASEQRYRSIFASTSDAIVICDAATFGITDVNPAVRNVYGYDPEQVVGMSLGALLPDGADPGSIRAEVVRCGALHLHSAMHRRQDGRLFPCSVTFSHLQPGVGELLCMSVRDRSEERRQEREIEAALVVERQRLQQDLHDRVCQKLTGLSFLAKALEHDLAAQPAPVLAQVREIREIASSAVEDTYRVIRGLQPLPDNAGALTSALLELAAQTSRSAGLLCEFMGDRSADVRNAAMANELYLVAVEAVRNAVTHSGGSRVVIRLRREGTQIVLRVEDDGKGSGDSSLSRPGGLGVRIMHARAMRVGGTIQLKPNAPHGTVVELRVTVSGTIGNGQEGTP